MADSTFEIARAISKATELPEGKIRDGLLAALSAALTNATYPAVSIGGQAESIGTNTAAKFCTQSWNSWPLTDNWNLIGQIGKHPLSHYANADPQKR